MRNFFNNIDFSFDKDFYRKDVEFSENKELTKKLQNKVFVYDNKNIEQTFSSFYIINAKLKEKELQEIRRYIWNEDKFDLFFYPENIETISLFYAKTSPDTKAIKIDSFKGKDEDKNKLEKIKKWKFQSGAFWLSYTEYIDKIKKNERIDVKLIQQLKFLKTKLLKTIGKNEIETVQSLIDRMLFVKFLEDNHIINSFFYQHFFSNKDLSYKELLQNKDAKSINLLFEKINEIFSNVLFVTPTIKDEFIINSSDLIYKAISQDIETGQLRLFDFRFDIIPIEFISHIYEVFLENAQLDQGIYYTPPKLAQLIIDDTITKTGKILDPACGSGMFLILGLRKLLENNPVPENTIISKKISHKIDLLQKYIFGIEKENTAWRLTVFSLYLEVLKDLPQNEIKEYIEQKIAKDTNIKIFPDFTNNIKNGNSLEVSDEKKHFPNQKFDYIIGNPPFLQILKDDKEIDFINNYKSEINGKCLRATDVIGYNQISQAFMLKIKDWANEETKFGFVLNSSNFYNEKSEKFQEFFFTYYQIESFYELSRVKKILFKKAKESVIVIIFSNKTDKNNKFKYYPVDLELFSETFGTLVIHEDKRINLLQSDTLKKNIVLRHYLVGNEYDLVLANKLAKQEKLSEFLLKDKRYNSFQGLTRHASNKIASYFNIPFSQFDKFSREEKNKYYKEYDSIHYIRHEKSDKFYIPYIYDYSLINEFSLSNFDGYTNFDLINNKNFQRSRNTFIFQDENILFCRVGKKIKAVFCKYDKVFSVNIFGVKLIDKKYYYLFTALLNSNVVNYFLNIILKKRPDGNLPRIDKDGLNQIPIPKELDEDIVTEISEISKQLAEKNIEYTKTTKDKLNELIYDLYDLSYTERQRVKDFFSDKKTVAPKHFEEYKKTLSNVLELYFENKPIIKEYQDKSFGFDLSVVAIYFNKSEDIQPTAEKTLKYIISEEILRNTKENFLVLREKIIGNNCIYITKSNNYRNWTKTKAFEDGKNILKLIKQ